MSIHGTSHNAKSGNDKPAIQHKPSPKPQWQPISKVPKWVREQLNKGHRVDIHAPIRPRVRYVKGKRYHYKVHNFVQGSYYRTIYSRKPRMWYWKKLKAGKT